MVNFIFKQNSKIQKSSVEINKALKQSIQTIKSTSRRIGGKFCFPPRFVSIVWDFSSNDPSSE